LVSLPIIRADLALEPVLVLLAVGHGGTLKRIGLFVWFVVGNVTGLVQVGQAQAYAKTEHIMSLNR
jgi:hypothetical protein